MLQNTKPEQNLCRFLFKKLVYNSLITTRFHQVLERYAV
jgi:hypothetical protein